MYPDKSIVRPKLSAGQVAKKVNLALYIHFYYETNKFVS